MRRSDTSKTPITRRELMLAAAGATFFYSNWARAATAPDPAPAAASAAAPSGPFTLPPLPYADNGLDPITASITRVTWII
jgi:Fe-Mn family superoxide dismutase